MRLSIYFLVNQLNATIRERPHASDCKFRRNAKVLVSRKMTALLKWIRRLARFSLATALWLNALFLLRFTPPRLSPLAVRLHLNLGETTVLVLIVSFSVLISYGVKNLLVDALYIYFFPFILLFLVIRLAYRFGRIFFRTNKPLKAVEVAQTALAPSQLQTPTVVGAPRKRQILDRIRREILRPFLQFTLLWALLLLLTSHRWLLMTALIIVLAHLARTLIKVSALAVFSIKGLSQLEVRIKGWAEKLIEKAILASRQAEDTQDVRQAWISISGLQLGVKLFQYRQAVAQGVIFLSVLLFGAIYTYMALLFSFAYYGIARVEGVTYGWADAFVTSIFIPFQFPDLPHNIYIKVLAGIHCVFVLGVGAGTVFGYLQRKVNSLYSVAEFLNQRFQDDELRTSVQVLTERFGTQKPVAPK